MVRQSFDGPLKHKSQGDHSRNDEVMGGLAARPNKRGLTPLPPVIPRKVRAAAIQEMRVVEVRPQQETI